MKIVHWKTQHISQSYLLINSKIFMETTGGDTSWLNGNNGRQNRSIHRMVIVGLLDSNKHEKKWCCESDTSEEFHG